MILADTSAWVEYDRGSGSAVDHRVHELISSGGPLCTTQPVLMEVLAGARTDEREAALRHLLHSVRLLPFEAVADFDAAATIYRRCRRSGVTPRGMVDCLIDAVAWRRGAALLAQDADLVRVAAVVGIDLDPATPIPEDWSPG